jgi:hypothetical protein
VSTIRAFARLQVLSGFGELARAGFIAATGVECSVANSLRLIRLHFADAQSRKRLAYITELPVEPRRNPAHDWLSLSPFARASVRISTRAAQSGRQYRIQEWLPFGTVLRRGQLCYRRLSSLNDRYEGIEVD